MDSSVKEDGHNIGGQDVIRLLMDVDETESPNPIGGHDNDEANDSHDDSQLLTIVTTTASTMDTDESCVLQSAPSVDHQADDDADSLSSRMGLLAEPTQLTAADLGHVAVGGSFFQVLPQGNLLCGDGPGAVLQTVNVTEDSDGLQTITLSDGTVAVIQRGILEKGDTEDQDEHNDLVPGLSNGESFQTVQLGDGSTALLAPSALTADWSSLDPTQLASPSDSSTEVTKAAAAVSTASLVTQGSSDVVFQGIQKRTVDKTFIQASDMNSLGSNNKSGGTEKNITMGDKAFQCKHLGCGRLYSTMHHLKVHERSHTGDKPFHCEFAGCNKSFATSYGLKSHKRVHTGEKPYNCPDESCVKAFKTSGDLQKHVRTHTGERPFKCPFEGCERAFTTSNIRKVHIRTHTGERPFICAEKGCGKAFSSATNYRNHIRIHTGEKPYVCTVQGCGKRFTEYSSLYKHHIVHTHTKPYVCNMCGKNYRQTSTLAMHRRMAHGEDIVNSEDTMLGIVQHNVMVSQGEEDSGEKSGQLQLRLAGPTGLSRGSNTNENTLVITTSQAGQVALVPHDKLGVLGPTEVSSGDSTTDVVSLLQHGALTVPVGELAGQQILVVTDPSQLDMLQLSQASSLKADQPSLTSPLPDDTGHMPDTNLAILGPSGVGVKTESKMASFSSE